MRGARRPVHGDRRRAPLTTRLLDERHRRRCKTTARCGGVRAGGAVRSHRVHAHAGRAHVSTSGLRSSAVGPLSARPNWWRRSGRRAGDPWFMNLVCIAAGIGLQPPLAARARTRGRRERSSSSSARTEEGLALRPGSLFSPMFQFEDQAAALATAEHRAAGELRTSARSGADGSARRGPTAERCRRDAAHCTRRHARRGGPAVNDADLLAGHTDRCAWRRDGHRLRAPMVARP